MKSKVTILAASLVALSISVAVHAKPLLSDSHRTQTRPYIRVFNVEVTKTRQYSVSRHQVCVHNASSSSWLISMLLNASKGFWFSKTPSRRAARETVFLPSRPTVLLRRSRAERLSEQKANWDLAVRDAEAWLLQHGRSRRYSGSFTYNLMGSRARSFALHAASPRPQWVRLIVHTLMDETNNVVAFSEEVIEGGVKKQKEYTAEELAELYARKNVAFELLACGVMLNRELVEDFAKAVDAPVVGADGYVMLRPDGSYYVARELPAKPYLPAEPEGTWYVAFPPLR